MTSPEIIRKILYELNLNALQFSKTMGMNNATSIYAITNGGAISERMAVKINERYPQYSVKWLLGREERVNIASEPQPDYVKITNGKANTDGRGVPYYGINQKSLSGKLPEPTYHIDNPSLNDCDMVVDYDGISMNPVIQTGDKLYLKKIGEWREFILFGEVYVIVTSQMAVVRIIDGADDETITMKSHPSTGLSAQDIAKSLIKEIYSVHALERKNVNYV